MSAAIATARGPRGLTFPRSAGRCQAAERRRPLGSPWPLQGAQPSGVQDRGPLRTETWRLVTRSQLGPPPCVRPGQCPGHVAKAHNRGVATLGTPLAHLGPQETAAGGSVQIRSHKAPPSQGWTPTRGTGNRIINHPCNLRENLMRLIFNGSLNIHAPRCHVRGCWLRPPRRSPWRPRCLLGGPTQVGSRGPSPVSQLGKAGCRPRPRPVHPSAAPRGESSQSWDTGPPRPADSDGHAALCLSGRWTQTGPTAPGTPAVTPGLGPSASEPREPVPHTRTCSSGHLAASVLSPGRTDWTRMRVRRRAPDGRPPLPGRAAEAQGGGLRV